VSQCGRKSALVRTGVDENSMLVFMIDSFLNCVSMWEMYNWLYCGCKRCANHLLLSLHSVMIAKSVFLMLIWMSGKG